MRLNHAQFSLVILAAGVLAGCGGGLSDTPKLASVSGTVTIDGQPVSGVTVLFVSNKNQTRPGQGQTDAEGKFTLFFGTQGTGAPLGDNMIQLEVPDTFEGDEAVEPEEGDEPPVKLSHEIPAAYLQPFMNFDVQPGANEVKIELDSSKEMDLSEGDSYGE